MNKALIVVDVQKGFCEGGNLPIKGGNAVAERIAALLQTEHEYAAVAMTMDWHVDPGDHFSMTPDFVTSWPAHCVAGTPDADLHHALRKTTSVTYGGNRLGATQRFYKGQHGHGYSGFEGRDAADVPLHVWLMAHKIEAVDIVGIAYDYCVKATAIDAATRGYDTTVLRDLTVAIAFDTSDTTVELVRAGAKVVMSNERE